jgi:outer membrane protein OmpA-like peptidoglycan-associated protein
MGKIFNRKNPTRGLTTGLEVIILVVALAGVCFGLYKFAPGLLVGESIQLEAMEVNNDHIDNVTNSDMLPLPTKQISTKVATKSRVRIAGYAWNGQTPMIVANGGPFTTKGSLMEQNGVNLQIVRQDWLSELKTMQLKFIEQYNSGQEYPESDKAAFAIIIMGDGAPFYVSTMNKTLAEKFPDGTVDSEGRPNSKYHVQVIGAFGMSNGEDKLIGPAEWKANPQSMLGSVISVVLGDGDWVTALNYCFANGLKVNPDVTTYDPNAVNFYASADDDYINSAKELIASQKAGFTVELQEVSNGKLTGNMIKRKIDGCATWTPGDKMVFDALSGFTDIASTADFPNQMATTVIAVKEWSMQHSDLVTDMLASTYTASNQMKQYDAWRVAGSDAVATTFDMETPKYWYDMYKGQTGNKDGLSYNMGGTRCLTYADAMQYYGMTDGINRYKSVYNQVSNYLTELNPFGFNESVKGVTPYSEAVNLFFLKNINDVDAGVTEKTDYSETKTKVMASGNWSIEFATGSDNLKSSSNRDLESIYNLLVQAEQTRVTIVGHTDNTGSNTVNQPLSYDRANAVVNYLVNRGISRSRIQSVEGKGSSNPIADNTTSRGRADNRRVEITLLQ